jgi:hypothetical protein
VVALANNDPGERASEMGAGLYRRIGFEDLGSNARGTRVADKQWRLRPLARRATAAGSSRIGLRGAAGSERFGASSDRKES